MAAPTWSAAPLPPQTVQAVREALGSLTDDIVAAVRAENQVYEEVLGGPEGIGIRLGIEQALKTFLDAIERGERPVSEAGEVWRRLGEAEFQAGRSLEALRAAFRTGTRAAWRGAANLAAAAGVSTTEVVALAEGIFVYTDELAGDVVEGYLQMQSDQAGERERRRRRLAGLLVDPEQHDPEAIERAAELARWTMPRELAALALETESGSARLDGDVLAGADADGAWLLVPDPDAPGRWARLRKVLRGRSAVLGPTVAPRDAARSLRWARTALALMQRGALGPAGPARVADHLTDLLLLQDIDLAQSLAAQRLAPLDDLPPADAERLLQTLTAWLDHQRHTPRIAAELHVHPQTVRYRIGQLRELLGEALDTPQGRFELGLAVRVRRASNRRYDRLQATEGDTMAEATKAPSRSQNGQTPVRSGPVAERVARLREQARTDGSAAREEAWSWIEQLGDRARHDRAGALQELQELFVCGQPATGIDGQTQGILVTWTMQPLADRAIGAITSAWMPWLGKNFDPEQQTGVNTLTNSARWPAKLLWPLYATRESPLGRSAFDFKTYVEAGRLDPEIDVLVIDYERVPENPNLLIRQIRDELVQIVPGANLGKMLVNVPRRERPYLALYFALKSEA